MTRDTSFFWDGALRRELLIQRCTTCETLRHPPTASCAHCGSLEWDAVESRGRGIVYSFTVVHAPVQPPFESPYVVGLIALDEGTRLVSQIVDVDPRDVRIGLQVELTWHECDDDLTLPLFRPAE
jgi:uncharacterized OB-fold protein